MVRIFERGRDNDEERYEDCDRCGERYHGEYIDAYLRTEERWGGERWRVCCTPIMNIKGYKA